MTLLTVSELQEHIETDLGNDAIQRLADAAESTINRYAGGTGAQTENINCWGFPRGRERSIYTSRAVSSITSIKERDHPDDTPLTLSANDYELQGDRRLIRLREGDNPRLFWARHVEIVYSPVSDLDTRKLVQINLVKHAIVYSGAQRERIGDFDFWHKETDSEVRAILAPLNNSQNRMPMR